MFKAGASGYILKGCEPADIRDALHAVATKGYYYTEMITGKIIHSIKSTDDELTGKSNSLSKTEKNSWASLARN